MKNLFPGYYRPTQEEFKEIWSNCKFILDTNVILNLYRYNESTRTDFLNTLQKIESRLWIPHQVALEYQENRYQTIKIESTRLDRIKSDLKRIELEVHDSLSKYPSISSAKLLEKVSDLFNEFSEEISASSTQIKPNECDPLQEQLNGLFSGRIGKPPENQEELNSIYKEGEERYKIKCPPGYKDDKKEGTSLYEKMLFRHKYGDLILWKQILKAAKENKWKYVIFVTDDEKEDWWREEKGETIGAHPELVKEIYDIGVSFFYMYNSKNFLRYAKQYIEVDIRDESIQQVEDITEFLTSTEREYKARSSKKLSAAQKSFITERVFYRWLKYTHSGCTIKNYRLNSDYGVDFLISNDNSDIPFAGFNLKLYSRKSTVSSLINKFFLQEKPFSQGIEFTYGIYLVIAFIDYPPKEFVEKAIEIFDMNVRQHTERIFLILSQINLDPFDFDGNNRSEAIVLAANEATFDVLYSTDPSIPLGFKDDLE